MSKQPYILHKSTLAFLNHTFEEQITSYLHQQLQVIQSQMFLIYLIKALYKIFLLL